MFAKVLVAMSHAPPSHAAEPGTGSETPAPAALELSEDARNRYDRGEYERALVLFNEAYAREPDPNLLFNIARCHEKLGQPQAAIEKYEAFLASPNGDPTGREKAAASRDELVQRRELAASKSGKPASRTLGGETGESAPVPDGSVNLTPWLLLGAGVAAVASGVVVYSLGIRDHHELENQAGYGDPNRVVPMTQKDAEARVDFGKQQEARGRALARRWRRFARELGVVVRDRERRVLDQGGRRCFAARRCRHDSREVLR